MKINNNLVQHLSTYKVIIFDKGGELRNQLIFSFLKKINKMEIFGQDY